jgi:hypothetical protein
MQCACAAAPCCSCCCARGHRILLRTCARAPANRAAPLPDPAPADAFTRKDVAYNLENTADPEAEAAIRAFQRDAYKAAAKGAAALAPPAEAELAFTAKVERKYEAAKIVESGIQVRGRRVQARRQTPAGCALTGGRHASWQARAAGPRGRAGKEARGAGKGADEPWA